MRPTGEQPVGTHKNVRRITVRQAHALWLGAQGLPYVEIGAALGVKPGTVHALLGRAFDSLGVNGQQEAWRALGWLRPPTGRPAEQILVHEANT